MMHAGFNVISMFYLSVLPDKSLWTHLDHAPYKSVTVRVETGSKQLLIDKWKYFPQVYAERNVSDRSCRKCKAKEHSKLNLQLIIYKQPFIKSLCL